MALGSSGRRKEPLNVLWMAGALVLAAILGAAAGVLWHWSGLGDDAPEVTGAVAD